MEAPRLSVVIPAYNEAPWLPATLEAARAALAQVGVAHEIIVVDNNSTDATAELARAQGARVVFEPVNQISRARNRGARAARGRELLFLDADTELEAGVLRELLAVLDDGAAGGGVPVVFDRPVPFWARWGLRLWNFASRRLRVAAGALLFCRRDGFEAVGGFSEQVYAGEELWLSRRLRAWGRRHGRPFVILARPARTSARKLDWYTPGQQFAMLALLLVFPFATRFRRLSSFWYRRPPP